MSKWEPVEDGDYDDLCDYFRDTFAVEEGGARITFVDASFPFDPARGSLDLPDDIRLCRQVDSAPLVEMTEARRDALRALLDYCNNDYDARHVGDIDEILRAMLNEVEDADGNT